jgi:Uma2 family endonuclease
VTFFDSGLEIFFLNHPQHPTMNSHSQDGNACDPQGREDSDTKALDFDNLDLDRRYTLDEYERICGWLKIGKVKIDEKSQRHPDFKGPIHHFERDSAEFLVPLPPTTKYKEGVVAEISRQLANWNVQTQQNGLVTTSQGGYKISGNEILAPDVAFQPKDIYRSLDNDQLHSFRGEPDHPTFVVEVDDVSSPGKLETLIKKFKERYFLAGVELGWLVDPVNLTIHSFKRDINGSVRRYEHGWRNLSGGETLPGFTLEVWECDEAVAQV